MKGVDLTKLTEKWVNLPMHVGAVKYFGERAVKLQDVAIPPEAKERCRLGGVRSLGGG